MNPRALSALASLAGAVILFSAAPAAACGYMLGPNATPRFPWWSAEGFPTNGLFASSFEWRDDGGSPLELVDATDVSEATGLMLRRAAAPLPAGGAFFTTGDCPATGDCRHRLSIAAGPDTQPPSKAMITGLRTLLIRDPVGTGGFTCPDIDNLELRVEGTDDTTPAEQLVTLAYVADTASAAESKAQVDVAFAFDLGPADDSKRALVSTIAIGEAVDRARDGEPFRAAGRFCFAVALMDWAGNIGERSDARCLDTTDLDDPTVEMVDGQGCACSGDPRRPSSSPALLIAVLLGLAFIRGGQPHRRRQ